MGIRRRDPRRPHLRSAFGRALLACMLVVGSLSLPAAAPSRAVSSTADPGGMPDNKVPWGTSADGMAIKAYIKEYEANYWGKDPGVWTELSNGRNIATFAYTETDGGPIRRVVVANAPSYMARWRDENVVIMVFDEDYELVSAEEWRNTTDIHSEQLLDDWLSEHNISSNRVFSGESERQECSGRCAIFLGSDPESKHGDYATLRKNGGLKHNFDEGEKNVDRNLGKERQAWRDSKNKVLQPAKEQKKRAAALAKKCPLKGALGGPGESTIGGQAVVLAAADPCSGDPSSALTDALTSGAYGGVDFSTLGIRYLSDGSGGVKYSFSGRPAPGFHQSLEEGLEATTDSTEDLRTWLVLDPNRFWVNLNPTEPDRIVDGQLGRTEAGRALLQADLQMKRTEGKLLDPNTALGARYWNALIGSSGKACYSSRLWIVPGDVEVRQDGDSIYILKAALHVKAKAQRIGGGYGCPDDPDVAARGERLEQTMLVPKVEQAVNTAPEYAPLRRAFLARVVAQWIRDRHRAGHRTSFDGLLDSGDLGPAVLQDGWQPRQVFDDYVRSVRDKDFTYRQTIRVGGTRVIRTLTTGGVDFGNVRASKVGSAQMRRQYPRLAETVKASRDHPAAAADGSIWLGENAGPVSGDGMWSRVGGTVGAFVTGRTGILVLILAALGLVVFGVRGPARRRA